MAADNFVPEMHKLEIRIALSDHLLKIKKGYKNSN